MTMSEPLLPHPAAESERTAAAEPGQVGPPPAAPEEPDVLPAEGDEGGDAHDSQPALHDTPFRTPKPGERLHPEDLAGDDAATHTD